MRSGAGPASLRTEAAKFSFSVSAGARHQRLNSVMARPEFLIFDPQALLKVRKAPAAEALARKLVTRLDLLRLKGIARLHARGLPAEVGWSDLLQEAFARVLDGSRKPPEGVPIVVFLAGVMRSIRSEHCRRARRQASQLPKMLADLDSDGEGSEPRDPRLDPERNLAVMQELGRASISSSPMIIAPARSSRACSRDARPSRSARGTTCPRPNTHRVASACGASCCGKG